MINFKQDADKFTVPGTTKMEMNSTITLVYQDGEVEMKVSEYRYTIATIVLFCAVCIAPAIIAGIMKLVELYGS